MPPSPPPDGASGTGPAQRYPVVRPPSPHPAPYVVGERSVGRHAAPADAGSTGTSPRRALMPAQTTTPGQTYGVRRTGLRHGGVYGTGVHRVDVPDLGVPDLGVPRAPAGVRRSGLYDTGVHRTGVYDSGVHRTDGRA